MKKLLILGAGGHGKVVADAAICQGEYKEICFLDDGVNVSVQNSYGKIIGCFSDSYEMKGVFSEVAVAIGDNKLRLEWINNLINFGYNLPVIIHPSAAVSTTVKISEGTVVMANAVINPDSYVGKGCIINTASSVDHDCSLKEGVHISPGAHLAGNVSIGRLSWVGTNASIIPNCYIEEDVIIAAGAVVIKDINKKGATVMGIPAQIIEKKYA